MDGPDISVILPAYNERGAIARTIGECVAYFHDRGWEYEIVVAADGADGTRELVAGMARDNPRLRVFGELGRHGKGRGVRQAVAMTKGAIVGYADADNKVPITEFDRLHPWFGDGYDVVIGCRALEPSLIERHQPLYRRLGGRGFHYVMQAVVGLPGIHDSQCGFKFFRGSTARRLFQRQCIDGYMFDVEILYLAQQAGCRIREVPIRWRDDGDSRLDLIRGNLHNMYDLLRIRLAHRNREES
ncbi:MAG TPA: dolichyl-phosphate beta-glucosyltransferase [Armatimonadota bacterium]|jgi:glycosyltransferase involved in cell wall biosynthesis